MSRNYKFHNPKGIYFVSFAVVDWIDVFTRPAYKQIIVESLSYCIKNKGMQVFAWCLMTNHMHIVFKSDNEVLPQTMLGDFKRYTSREIVKAIKDNPQESRKEWMLKAFHYAGEESSNNSNHQFWRHDNKPIELWTNAVIDEKINYVHNNPVEEQIVLKAEYYLYSSARDYCGGRGLVEGIVVMN